jgi:hypothetical protein
MRRAQNVRQHPASSSAAQEIRDFLNGKPVPAAHIAPAFMERISMNEAF